MKKYVLTGGQGTGKSTLLARLSARGFRTLPEAARQVIEEELAAASDRLPWKDLAAFQQRVVRLQLEWEDGLNDGNDIIFLDRSIIDGHSYSRHGGAETPAEIAHHARGRYDRVFVLEPLPTYENDACRRETKEEQVVIHNLVIEDYRSFGYEPIFVPVLPVEERADYILKYLD